MERRKFRREFKLEAVSLVKDRGVAVAQAARDLDLHDNVLRKWVRELGKDPKQAFLGHASDSLAAVTAAEIGGTSMADRKTSVIVKLNWRNSDSARLFATI
jgi:transposase-like protein